MSLNNCNIQHECAGVAQGKCNQTLGHMGKHICGSCLSFFGVEEAGRLQPGNEQVREKHETGGFWRPPDLKPAKTQDAQALAQRITQLEQKIAATRAQAKQQHSQASTLLADPYKAAAGATMETRAAALDDQVSAMEAELAELRSQRH